MENQQQPKREISLTALVLILLFNILLYALSDVAGQLFFGFFGFWILLYLVYKIFT